VPIIDIKIGSCVFRISAFTSLVTDERTDGRTHGHVENIMLPLGADIKIQDFN